MDAFLARVVAHRAVEQCADLHCRGCGAPLHDLNKPGFCSSPGCQRRRREDAAVEHLRRARDH